MPMWTPSPCSEPGRSLPAEAAHFLPAREDRRFHRTAVVPKFMRSRADDGMERARLKPELRVRGLPGTRTARAERQGRRVPASLLKKMPSPAIEKEQTFLRRREAPDRTAMEREEGV